MNMKKFDKLFAAVKAAKTEVEAVHYRQIQHNEDFYRTRIHKKDEFLEIMASRSEAERKLLNAQ